MSARLSWIFCESMTKVERKIASKLTIKVRRPNPKIVYSSDRKRFGFSLNFSHQFNF